MVDTGSEVCFIFYRIPRCSAAGINASVSNLGMDQFGLVPSLCGGVLHTPQLCCVDAPPPFDLGLDPVVETSH